MTKKTSERAPYQGEWDRTHQDQFGFSCDEKCQCLGRDDDLGPTSRNAVECDRSDPERCVIQEHGHGLRAGPATTGADKPDANSYQPGGDHYIKRGALQPWDVIAEWDLDFFQGNIMKYVVRWRDKNGLADLEKAMHYLQKYIEVEREKAEDE